MPERIKAGIIGATGYAGVELARILLIHPHVEITAVSSVSFEGKTLQEVYPSLAGEIPLTLCAHSDVIERCDIIFASLPHGLSESIAAACDKAGKLLIDLGADFRLENEDDYVMWYGGSYEDEALHKKAVYSIPELFGKRLQGARIIANPGCYPTSAALGLAPLLNAGLLDISSIIIDAKSGVTGAGRGPSQNTHYPDCNEAFSPYKVATHRHTPEIEQTLTYLAGEPVRVTFVPHLLPVNRGILSTIYALPKVSAPFDIRSLYNDFYDGKTFVRIMEEGKTADIRYVKNSNYCDISLHTDPRTGRIIVISAIDNMVKGAAGQAVQNMNLALGLPEEAGLRMIATAF